MKEHGLENDVIFLGYVSEEEKALLYRNAAGLLFVSDYEGFGIPILEGASYGIPVITSNTSSMREVAEGYAITVDPHDVNAIAAAIEDILVPETRESLVVQDVRFPEDLRLIGFPEDKPYYNVSVMLFDAVLWRKEKWENTVVTTICEKHREYALPEQDLLNLLLCGNVKKLSPIYNFNIDFLSFGVNDAYRLWELKKICGYYSPQELIAASENVRIYHFITGIHGRPWIKGSFCAKMELWESWRQRSAWAQTDFSHYALPSGVRRQQIVWKLCPRCLFFVIYASVRKVRSLKLRMFTPVLSKTQ